MSRGQEGEIPGPGERDRVVGDDGEAWGGDTGRALLLLRDHRDAAFLRGQLQHMGYRVTLTRNPFSALDALRWRRHELIVSEFELWADDGRLLFERMSSRGETAPVVFVGDRGADFPRRALRAGAVGVVTRPLESDGVFRAVRGAVEVWEKARIRGEPRSRPPLSAARAEPGEAPVGAAPAPAGPAEARASREFPSADADESRWLRFFFELRRRLRSADGREGRLAETVDCFRETLQPLAVMIAEPSPGGQRLYLDEALRSGALARESRDPQAWGELFVGLVSNDESPPGVLGVTFPCGGSRPAYFLVHFGAGRSTGRSEFHDELRILLADAAREGSEPTGL